MSLRALMASSGFLNLPSFITFPFGPTIYALHVCPHLSKQTPVTPDVLSLLLGLFLALSFSFIALRFVIRLSWVSWFMWSTTNPGDTCLPVINSTAIRCNIYLMPSTFTYSYLSFLFPISAPRPHSIASWLNPNEFSCIGVVFNNPFKYSIFHINLFA